jgi:hypothetical protein
MFDQINLVNPKRGKFVFALGQLPTATALNPIPVAIPRNASWVYMLAIGGAAGGAGGQSSGAGVVGGGGGGGGTGAFSRLIVPAFAIPASIFLIPGIGGFGGNSNQPGGAGSRSIIVDSAISTVPSPSADIILVSVSAAAAAPPAAAGASSAGGAGETAPGAVNNQVYASLGLWVVQAGGAGTAGGATGGNGVSVVWGASGILASPGTGGGSSSVAGGWGTGGPITAAGPLFDTLAGGIAGGGNGQPGISSSMALMPGALGSAVIGRLGHLCTGGTGGGANNGGGTGGAGGKGGIGCGGGGGGGGGGTGGGVGGRGGDGGPGLIVVAWW